MKYKPVPLPQKNVIINDHNKKKTPYVYHLGKGFRNNKNQPACKQTLIGRKDGDMLIPNDKYFALFGGSPILQSPEIKAVRNFGDYFLLDSIFSDFKLDKILSNVFGELTDKMMLLAIYMVLEGNVMLYVDDWWEETCTSLSEAIDSQEISRLFNELDYSKRMEFFSAWVNARNQQEYIAYDVTSISSYSRNENIEYGYNRDKEMFPKLNLGVYYGESSMLPLYYSVYPGSITDKTHLPYMMADADRLGIKDMKYVMDRGFYSKSNLEYMAKCGHRFTIGIPGNLLVVQRSIDKLKDSLQSTRYCVTKNRIRGITRETSELGVRMNLHIYYSKEKALDEENMLLENVDILEERHRKHPELWENLSVKERSYFVEDGLERNYEEIDKQISKQGYFVIGSTDFKRIQNERHNREEL